MNHEEDAIDSADRSGGETVSADAGPPSVHLDGRFGPGDSDGRSRLSDSDGRSGSDDSDARSRFDDSGSESADPYGVDLPAGWSARSGDRTAVYESSGGAHRVRVVEFSRGLSLYWWVDVFVRDAGEWRRREVGLGDSYTDSDEAASAVESYLDRVDRGADPGRE